MAKNNTPITDTELKLNEIIKSKAYDAGLKRLRKRLSTPERYFSYFSQSKAIDGISDLLGATIARPMPLLCGSIIAFIGTFITVYLSNHYGYSYNYFLIVYLFIGGYLIELVVELVIKLLSRSK